jgi:hypothetical protein
MTKVAVTEPIPADLAEAMREFNILIEEGDLAATTPADDLLQWKNVCGGLLEEGGKEFAFGYFPYPRDDAGKVIWWLRLTADQITAIANAKLKQLNLWRCDPDCRCRFSLSDIGSCEICDH